MPPIWGRRSGLFIEAAEERLKPLWSRPLARSGERANKRQLRVWSDGRAQAQTRRKEWQSPQRHCGNREFHPREARMIEEGRGQAMTGLPRGRSLALQCCSLKPRAQLDRPRPIPWRHIPTASSSSHAPPPGPNMRPAIRQSEPAPHAVGAGSGDRGRETSPGIEGRSQQSIFFPFAQETLAVGPPEATNSERKPLVPAPQSELPAGPKS